MNHHCINAWLQDQRKTTRNRVPLITVLYYRRTARRSVLEVEGRPSPELLGCMPGTSSPSRVLLQAISFYLCGRVKDLIFSESPRATATTPKSGDNQKVAEKCLAIDGNRSVRLSVTPMPLLYCTSGTHCFVTRATNLNLTGTIYSRGLCGNRGDLALAQFLKLVNTSTLLVYLSLKKYSGARIASIAHSVVEKPSRQHGGHATPTPDGWFTSKGRDALDTEVPDGRGVKTVLRDPNFENWRASSNYQESLHSSQQSRVSSNLDEADHFVPVKDKERSKRFTLSMHSWSTRNVFCQTERFLCEF
ncbi:hypothetical protein BD410DRAFT_805038 [Rickenella mellea]|uniref:Uncharacterized protein n=1 Tax=Rickenella mellea TaxID=50990 RepID=A0A4Y7Q111_9AGAM|nr:hypothetical protein BD410DRAFT_805038 [Rickenella mellea]